MFKPIKIYAKTQKGKKRDRLFLPYGAVHEDLMYQMAQRIC